MKRGMVLLLTLLTAAYTAVIVWVRREKRRPARPGLGAVLSSPLPADDQPPSTAVGWPPKGAAFETYLADGFAALDAFLSEDHTS